MGDGSCRPAYVALLADLSARARGRALRGPPRPDRRQPAAGARLQAARVPGRHRGGPRLVDHLCEDCAPHFARVRGGARRARDQGHASTTAWSAASTTTRAPPSSSPRPPSRRPRTGSAGAAATTGWPRPWAGRATPGIGFGIGIERVLLACDAEGCFAAAPPPLDACVVDLVDGGDGPRPDASSCATPGLRVDRAFDGRSLKAQCKAADRSGARRADRRARGAGGRHRALRPLARRRAARGAAVRGWPRRAAGRCGAAP